MMMMIYLFSKFTKFQWKNWELSVGQFNWLHNILTNTIIQDICFSLACFSKYSYLMFIELDVQ